MFTFLYNEELGGSFFMELTFIEYKTIVETAPNLIWRSGLDAKCYYFNKTWLDFTGRTYEQEYGDG